LTSLLDTLPARLQPAGNRERDFGLHGEDVRHFAVVALRPQPETVRGVYQLHRHADAITGAPHAAVERRGNWFISRLTRAPIRRAGSYTIPCRLDSGV
jgi:hypothetical protein